MKKGMSDIMLLIIITIVAFVGVAGTIVFTQQPEQITEDFVGTFSEFGKNVSGDHLTVTQQVEWDDEDQTTAGAGLLEEYQQKAVANETVQAISDDTDLGFFDLANSNIDDTSVVLWNQTGNTKFGSSKYTLNRTDGGIDLDSSIEATNTEVTIDYNHLPSQGKVNKIAKLYFEIEDGPARSATFSMELSTAMEAFVDQQNIDWSVREAQIRTYEDEKVVAELDETALYKGDEVTVAPVKPGEYIAYVEIERGVFTPLPSTGQITEFYVDAELDSDAEDEPIEVSDFAVNARTIAP